MVAAAGGEPAAKGCARAMSIIAARDFR